MSENPETRRHTTEAGFVLLDKASGWTSHDAVARSRRVLGTRKVGHAGTLDPLATGLLLIGVNRATRLLGYLSDAGKEYVSRICLGVSTHSDDADGVITAVQNASHLTRPAVERILATMVGEIDQVPSAVSAIKVDGKRAHARVRAGEDFDLPARRVTIHSIDVLDFEPGEKSYLTIRVRCSSGTYIRAIARDLGAQLEVGGHVTELRRTRIGPFDVADAQTMDEFSAEPRLVPMALVARAVFPSLELSESQAVDVSFGRTLAEVYFESDQVGAVFSPDGQFLALYKNSKDGIAPVAVFV